MKLSEQKILHAWIQNAVASVVEDIDTEKKLTAKEIEEINERAQVSIVSHFPELLPLWIWHQWIPTDRLDAIASYSFHITADREYDTERYLKNESPARSVVYSNLIEDRKANDRARERRRKSVENDQAEIKRKEQLARKAEKARMRRAKAKEHRGHR